MNGKVDWGGHLRAALADERGARSMLGGLLLEWAYANLHGVLQQDREEIAALFAANLSADGFRPLRTMDATRIRPYLRAALRNCLVSHFRVEKRRNEREACFSQLACSEAGADAFPSAHEPGVHLDTPEAVVMRKEAIAQVWEEVGQLAVLDQRIFELFVAGGLSESRVAGELGLSIGTVSRRVCALRRRLRCRLGREWPR